MYPAESICIMEQPIIGLMELSYAFEGSYGRKDWNSQVPVRPIRRAALYSCSILGSPVETGRIHDVECRLKIAG